MLWVALPLLWLLASPAAADSFPSSLLSDLSALNIPFTCNSSNYTEVLINTTSDLQNIVSLRKQFPATQFVVMTLTAVNVRDPVTGAITASAYNSSSALSTWNSSMSCTVIRGQGMNSTQILVNNFNALQTLGANDLVFVDLSIDRYSSPYDNQANYCLWLNFYNTSNPAYSQPPCTNITKYWSDTSGLGGGATFVKSGSRVGFMRFGTSGGISISTGNNHSIYSCVISSPINGITTFANNYLLIFNNSVTAPWGSGIYVNQQSYANMSRNYLYDTGFSCFYSRRSFFQNVMLNYCRNFTTLPNSQTGAAGWYTWNGLGWKAWGKVVKNNWFYSPSSKCWYLDNVESNIVFDSNVCFTTVSETNGGRFNNLTNNLWLFFRPSLSGARLGDLNCFGTSDNYVKGPNSTLSCSLALNTGTGDYSFFTQTLWSNFLANGTRVSSPDYSGTPLDVAPQLSHDTWCAPTTAGPSKVSCSNSKNTYTWNNVTYPMPCESLPSNNVFQFAVLYNTSSQIPYFSPGFACDCPGPACGAINSTMWGNYSFKSSSIVLSLNTFKTSFYKTSSGNSSALTGYNYNFDSPIDPKNFKIDPTSTLGISEPQLLNIPFSQIGLLPYVAPNSSSNPSATEKVRASTVGNQGGNSMMSVAGIAVGVVVGAVCIGAGVFYFAKKSKRGSTSAVLLDTSDKSM